MVIELNDMSLKYVSKIQRLFYRIHKISNGRRHLNIDELIRVWIGSDRLDFTPTIERPTETHFRLILLNISLRIDITLDIEQPLLSNDIYNVTWSHEGDLTINNTETKEKHYLSKFKFK
jgi:hypothetical protein